MSPVICRVTSCFKHMLSERERVCWLERALSHDHNAVCYCVYRMSLELKPCCTDMLALCVSFFHGALLIGFCSGLCDVMKTTVVCLESQGFDHRVLMQTAG